MSRVLLATCREFASGEPGHEALDSALAARGVDATWAVWEDPSVDWSAADVVAVRSTWDYMSRLDEFLAWAERLDHVLVHGSQAFRWNTDKRYLLDLGRAGVPVVPTRVAATEEAVLLVSLRERHALGTKVFPRSAVQPHDDVRSVADLVYPGLVVRGDRPGVVADAVLGCGPRGRRGRGR